MNSTVNRIKSISFALLYIAIYYVVSFAVYNIGYYWHVSYGVSSVTAEEFANDNLYSLSVVIWLICMLCYILIGKIRKEPINQNVRRNKVPPIIFVMATTLAFGCRFLVSVYYSFSQNITVLEKSIEKAAQNIPAITTPEQLLLALLCTVVVAPYFEEVLFRGLVMGELLKIVRPWVAIVLQAIVFGAVHGVLFQSIFAGVIGLALGILYYRTKNIRTTVLCHCMFNFSAMFMQGNLPVSGLILYSAAGIILCGLSLIYILSGSKKDSSF